jgi:GLPGLI family protein
MSIASAQNSNGKIIYEETVKLKLVIDDNGPPMMDSLPKEHTSQKLLYFTPDASLYQNDKSKERSDGIEQNGDEGRIMIKMNAPDDESYCDLKNNKLIERKELMSRKFLITSDIKAFQWKLTGREKSILNYPCNEATLELKDRKVTAWFTTKIPLSTGPAGYGNLPGLILELSINNGDRTIIARQIDFGEVDKKLLTPPGDGKKVTREEYEQIFADKRKEMQTGNDSDNGNVIIKIRH